MFESGLSRLKDYQDWRILPTAPLARGNQKFILNILKSGKS
jgi:hypothetical protein